MRNRRRILLTALLGVATLCCAATISVPDSLLSISHAYQYSIASPDTAMAIVQTMRQRQMKPAWRLDIAEGELNFQQKRYQKALVCYKRITDGQLSSDNKCDQLEIQKRVMDCHDALYHDEELLTTLYHLRAAARDCGNEVYETMTNFMGGKWLHFVGLTEQGYKQCLEAVESMKASDYPDKHIELCNYYTNIINMYARDKRYDEALRMSELQEAEARQQLQSPIRLAGERALRLVFAQRASVLAKTGRNAEADKAYRAWKKTGGGNDIDDLVMFDYLRLRHHHDEALAVIMRYREFIHAQGDTLSVRMLMVHNKEAILHVDMGDYEKAMQHGNEVGVIADSLYARRSRAQMEALRNLLMEQKVSSRKTLWLFMLSAALVVVLMMALVILHYVRKTRKQNEHLRHLFNSFNAYRNAILSGEKLAPPVEAELLESIRSIQDESHLPEQTDAQPDDEDYRLFVEMDAQVTREQLFLKPGLGREDLMRLVGVDKNRFGKMISKYSEATNTSVYINTKRVEYGAKLLLEHPEYTIATIAEECGMTNTVTFNRCFKELFGVTPSQYRQRMQN